MDVERGGARATRAPSPSVAASRNRARASRIIGYALICVLCVWALTRSNRSSARSQPRERVAQPLAGLGESHLALFDPVLSGLLRDIDGDVVTNVGKSRLTLVTNVASK